MNTVQAARLLIEAVGKDPSRDGLIRTPERFAKAFQHLCSGYHKIAFDVKDAIQKNRIDFIGPLAEGSGS